MQKLKDKIVSVLSVAIVLFLGMFGGQKNKGTRRFGVPGIAIIAAILTNNIKIRDFCWILLLPVLTIGYGENSWLFGVLKLDWLVRLVYAFMLSVPFLFYGWIRFVIAAVCLVGAFQIHAGSLGTISWFGDILIEDICRYGILGLLIAYNIYKDK